MRNQWSGTMTGKEKPETRLLPLLDVYEKKEGKRRAPMKKGT
jgi:hypothetical protein